MAKNGPTEVRWHPPATSIADGGPVGTGLQPERIRYKGKEWVVAWSYTQRILWVLADSDDEVKRPDNAGHLVDIATAYRTNAVNKTLWLEVLGPADTSVEAVSKRGREVTAGGAKHLALREVTKAVQAALAAGAKLPDVRVAVYAAMGLDDDVAA